MDKKISTLMVKICKQRYDDVMWRHSYFVKKSQTQCQTDSLRLKLKVVFCTSNGSGTTRNLGFGFFTRNPGLEKDMLLLNKDFHYLFFAKIWLDLLKIFFNGECAKDPTKFWKYYLHQILQRFGRNMKKILVGLVFYA